VGIAGGVESLSNPSIFWTRHATRVFSELRGARSLKERARVLSKFRPADFVPHAPGVNEPSTGMSMGEHTEITVKEWGISRAEQDEIAFRSHMNAAAATDDDRLTAEIHPLARLNPDPIIRPGTSMERLAQLSPVFDKSAHGTLTAGNSSPLTDGASATVLMSESAAKAHGFTPLAYVKAIEFAAIHPDDGLLMGPGVAVPRLLRRVRLDLDDIDIIEMHEAFGGQVASNLAAWEHGGRMSRSGMWTATSSTLKGGRSPSATPSPPPDLASSTNSPTRWNVVTPVSGW